LINPQISMLWPTKKLEEVATVFSGSTAPQDEAYFNNSEFPFVRVSDLNGERNSNLCNTRDMVNRKAVQELRLVKARKGSIIFPKSGAAILNNSRAILGVDAYVVSHLAVIEADDEQVLKEWLYQFLCNYDMGELVADPAYPSLKLSAVKEIEIPLPPIKEQRRVVEKIEKLFAKIDEIAALRQSALEDSAALLPSALHHIYARAEKEGWEEKPLSEVAIINPPKSETKHLPDTMEVSFVPMAAVNEQSQSIEDGQIRKLGQVRKGYTYFMDGDVLFAKITPSMENGKIILADNLKNGIGFGTTEFHVIRPTKRILSKWIKHYLWNPSFRDEAEQHMTGTAGQQRVPVEYLGKSIIPLPPIAEQKKIVAYLDSLSAKAHQLQEVQENTAEDLAALRQSILHRAFKGA